MWSLPGRSSVRVAWEDWMVEGVGNVWRNQVEMLQEGEEVVDQSLV